MQAKSTNDDVDARVRKRLRELRMQHGLTLEDVAARASIDISTLSRLESGKRRLALDHLPRLAQALSVSTDELLRAPEVPDPRVRGSSHTRHGITYWPLTRGGPAGGLHAFKVRISVRRRKPPAVHVCPRAWSFRSPVRGTRRICDGRPSQRSVRNG